MYNVSNTNGPIGYGEIPGEDGYTSDYAERKQLNKELILKANTVPLTYLFKLYGVRIDEHNKKASCPFPSHKGGRETTASFCYYPETNTYCCFGCRQGRSTSDFVSFMDQSTRRQAAQKIIELFESDVEEGSLSVTAEYFSESLELMMEFSNFVRDFREIYTDDDSFNFIESQCKVYDKINALHKVDNNGLRKIIDLVKLNTEKYIEIK